MQRGSMDRVSQVQTLSQGGGTMLETLMVAAFIALDAGLVIAALAWLSAKRQELDPTDLRHRDRPRVYRD
jgi:hypothetical protein